MKTTHVEADNFLAQQMVITESQPNNGVCVVSGDTDVFVLLLHFYAKYDLTGFVIMESPIKDRATINIESTVSANKDIILDLPAAHALSGSDTTACQMLWNRQNNCSKHSTNKIGNCIVYWRSYISV